MAREKAVAKMELGKKLTIGLAFAIFLILTAASMFVVTMSRVQSASGEFKAACEAGGFLTAAETAAYDKIIRISRQATTLILSITFLIVIVSIFGGLAVIRSIRVPVEKILKSIDEVKGGDLTANIESIKSGDEFELMGDSFNSMVAHLKDFMGVAHKLSGDTNTTVISVAATTGQASRNMGQIQNSIQQIATATSQVAKSTQEITVLAQGANKSVESGSTNISRVLENFRSVQIITETTGRSVTKLNQRSQEISEIVGLITKISDQTNLLALNAAIESARAGEAGRGFAVVADEVRKLAESSSQSAEKISRIIKEIQTDMLGVVQASSKAVEETRAVLELMIKMQDGYGEMVGAIKGISAQVEAIAATSEETAASAEEVTAGAEEQTAAITQISGIVEKLAMGASDLQGELNKFKFESEEPEKQGQ
ncbi:MAG: hypothetical protein A2X28_08570 [Elusimicrobia bacterium GWA2_56_46]|nr:MAG: hypothetical protein A2X28_08570 [Elusimicrobia bacterium GWA2_56_46]OGR55189.1 MAG: hypothetical protein A2X39_01475 [Elusimicrobia bacterium GWC2_56_31]HBB66289.1 hypothetical protein [Elusimicrobiota bacterium]HBW23737.1 hypothetical protein [Elusimicrobiota bacterium]